MAERPADVLMLQRTMGNQAVQRLFGLGKKKKRAVQGPKTERETFDAETFKLEDWQPTTKTGKFDAVYRPADGVMRIVMKVHFNFKNADLAYRDMAADPKEMKWTKSGKKEWTRNWIDAVMSKWGDIAPFTCDKPGYENVSVKPRIEIQVVGSPEKSHYALDITKAFRKNEGGMRAGGLSGVNAEGTGAFQEQDAFDKINDPKIAQHLAQTENTNNILPAYERDRERMEKVLEGIAPVLFKEHSAELADGADAAAKTAAARIMGLRRDSALADLHPINVNFALADGEQRSLILARFQSLKDELVREGVDNLFSAKHSLDGIPRSATFAAKPDAENVKELYLKRWDRYTAAHEFGHMIGLLDEYCPAVSPELILKMADEGAIGKTESDQELSAFAKQKERNNKDKQTAYAKLLDKTGLSVPNWARPTAAKEEKSTSLMSGGFEVLRQHHITLWEALTEMTKGYVEETHWKV